MNDFFNYKEKTNGNVWTFSRLNDVCDTPGEERVQAVLLSNDFNGFSLYARQKGITHMVTHNRKPVIFRTIEVALSTLIDVPYIDPEIIIDSSKWCADSGPV